MSRRGERGIWQRRYWEHTIRDDRDLAVHLDYIHFNPPHRQGDRFGFVPGSQPFRRLFDQGYDIRPVDRDDFSHLRLTISSVMI